MRNTSNANKWTNIYYPKNDSKAKENDSIGLCHWIEWIANQNREENDPFVDMKSEPLLCKQYRTLNETMEKTQRPT